MHGIILQMLKTFTYVLKEILKWNPKEEFSGVGELCLKPFFVSLCGTFHTQLSHALSGHW